MQSIFLDEDQSIDGYEELNDDHSYGPSVPRIRPAYNALANQSILHSDGPVAQILGAKSNSHTRSTLSTRDFDQPSTSQETHNGEISNSKSCCLQ